MERNGKIFKDLDIKFSVIIPIEYRSPNLDRVLRTDDQESEIIIVDNFHNSEKAKKIDNLKCFKKIKYVPPFDTIYPAGLSRLINSGLRISENDWIVIADRIIEFKPNFFDILREDIEAFLNAHQNEYFIIMAQILRENMHAKWNNYIQGYHSRFHVIGPEASPSLICLHKNAILPFRGMDERYDFGAGYNIQNLIHRLVVAGIPLYLDQYLMGFLYNDDLIERQVSTNCLLWEYDKIEIRKGKFLSYSSLL